MYGFARMAMEGKEIIVATEAEDRPRISRINKGLPSRRPAPGGDT